MHVPIRLLRAATLLGVFAIAPAPARSSGLVANGGFEAGPAMTPAGEVAIAAGATSLSSWAVSGGGVNFVSDIYWVPYQGTRSLMLNATGPGAISQSFATAPGAVYKLGFVMSGEPFTTPTLKHVRVSAAGQSIDYSYDNSDAWHWDMAWAPHQWTFTANAATTTLRFESLDAGFSGPAIDSVEVVLLTADAPAPAAGLVLDAVAPNPVRGEATIAWTLPREGDVRLTVTDAQGRLVATLADGAAAAGRHAVRWSAAGAAPGVYFVRLASAAGSAVRRLAVVR